MRAWRAWRWSRTAADGRGRLIRKRPEIKRRWRQLWRSWSGWPPIRRRHHSLQRTGPPKTRPRRQGKTCSSANSFPKGFMLGLFVACFRARRWRQIRRCHSSPSSPWRQLLADLFACRENSLSAPSLDGCFGELCGTQFDFSSTAQDELNGLSVAKSYHGLKATTTWNKWPLIQSQLSWHSLTFVFQIPVVQRLDSVTHRLNHYKLDN